LGVLGGCGDTRVETEPAGVVQAVAVPQEVLTEHRPLRSEKATKPLGADCTEEGASACLSGLCLHVKPGRKEGYVCSRACQGEQDCPRNWRCAQVYPTSEGRLCVPSPPGRGAAVGSE
jgi:hypothetical protein